MTQFADAVAVMRPHFPDFTDLPPTAEHEAPQDSVVLTNAQGLLLTFIPPTGDRGMRAVVARGPGLSEEHWQRLVGFQAAYGPLVEVEHPSSVFVEHEGLVARQIRQELVLKAQAVMGATQVDTGMLVGTATFVEVLLPALVDIDRVVFGYLPLSEHLEALAAAIREAQEAGQLSINHPLY